MLLFSMLKVVSGKKLDLVCTIFIEFKVKISFIENWNIYKLTFFNT